jgi:hypothetical protein
MSNGVTEVKEVTESDHAKDSLLNLVADGNPYVFVTVKLENRDGQDVLVTNLMSVLPGDLTAEVLKNALDSVDSLQ